VKYLNTVAIALGALLILNFSQPQIANAEEQITAPEVESAFLPQVDGRLNNEALRGRIYSVEDQSVVQSESIEALNLLVTDLAEQLKIAQEQLAVAEEKLVVTERDALDIKQSIKSLRAELQAEIKGSTTRTTGELSDLKGQLAQSNVAIEVLAQSNVAIEVLGGRLNSIETSMGLELTDVRSQLDQSKGDFSNLFNSVDKQFTGMGGVVSDQRLFGGVGLIVLVILLLILAMRMHSGSKALSGKLQDTSDELHKEHLDLEALSGKLQDTSDELHKEHLDLDVKLATLLKQQLDATSVSAESAAATEVDHTLPLQVAAEIHRMQKRLAAFPDDVKGVKPLVKALDRLNESLRDKNYEVVELLGTKYVEGMTFQDISFVQDDSIGAGEQVIKRVVKPQVNYQGKIIQLAEVEVSIGE
jgi:chromosome segregation ATPase